PRSTRVRSSAASDGYKIKPSARALPRLICIGEPSAQVAAELGLKVAAVAKTPDAAGLAQAISSCRQ
ncbi:hypothetical protein, partial [Varibaculum sp.]|uniref:hypothetical protein n=1 Tax=Varibaculum sp. TaxID=1895474 RepID=UPI0025D0C618